MIEQVYISANGIKQHLRRRNGGDEVILFIHGNGSDSVFWEELMDAMPDRYTCIAPDLRGFGLTEAVPAKAEKSFGDFVDDLLALIDREKIEKYTIISHSLGGGISWEMVLRDSQRIQKMVLVNPASPFGFGATSNVEGGLTYPDGAGSGAGVINPDFVELLQKKERGTGNPSAPLNVMNSFYWEPPFVPERVNDLLEGLLRMRVGEEFYPGDHSPSESFPFSKPGDKGQINCASPLSKTGILNQLSEVTQKPETLWIRGGKDKIVSDESLFDTAVLGKLGLIPNYPGADQCAPQPMVSQTRNALEKAGFNYREEVMEECGHSPYIEDLDGFMKILNPFLRG
ncbi:alpha/beta hydrolase [Cryomorphaceae bacterium 1068]|nr:alpha/beta hydrolase [Cryomorphaceae bacterium 1068]